MKPDITAQGDLVNSNCKKMLMQVLKPHTKMERMLPLSLIESDILPRLPVRSVGRCMCVCKQWKSFLSTPMFARMHLQHVTINDYKLLLLDGQSPATFHTVSTNVTCNNPPNDADPAASLFILATLDGLVCLASGEVSTQLAFWNPLTGAYKKLASRYPFDLNMITSDGAMGFYTDSCNDYKILLLIFGGLCGGSIYSNRLDSWREIKCSLSFGVSPLWSPATFSGDCLYFVVREMYNLIVCFDVKMETFRKIRFPPVLGYERDYCGSLAVLNGSIHLCVSDEMFKIGILWRKDGDDGWVKIAAFNDPLYNMSRREHICTTRTGSCVAVLELNDYYSFNMMNAEDFIKYYCYFCCPSWEYNFRRMMYVETLVSPNQ